MKTRIVFCLIVTILVLNIYVVYAVSLSDIAGTRYEEAVSRLVNDGVVNGFEDNTYKPQQNVTRAQLAKMLVELLKLKSIDTNTKEFIDVSESHWAYNHIKIAAENNIINGYEDNTFKPDKEVSFVEAATMILRNMNIDSELKNLSWPDGYILTAMSKGIYNNVEITDRDFGNPANRGEVAIMIYNFVKQFDEKNAIEEQASKENSKEVVKLDVNASWNGKYINVSDGYMELELNEDGTDLNYYFKGYKFGGIKLAKSTAEINGNSATEEREIFDDYLKLILTKTENGIMVTLDANSSKYDALKGLYVVDNGNINKVEYSNPNRLSAIYRLGDATITLEENPNNTLSFEYEYSSSAKHSSFSKLLNYENNIATFEEPGFMEDDAPSILKVTINPTEIIVEASADEDAIDSYLNEISGTYKFEKENSNGTTILEMKKKFEGYIAGDGVYMGF